MNNKSVDKKKILLTGFDPFGGETVNPSWEAVQILGKKTLDGIDLVTKQIPTIFHESQRRLCSYIDEIKPDIVLCIGQAGGRNALAVERVAINLDDARIPDNAENQPIDSLIVADGPAAYFATVPVKAMVQAVHNAGLPALVSHSAGTFVCNHVFYGALHYSALKKLPIRCGFIHIPYLPQQCIQHSSAASMALVDIVKGLEAALLAIVNNEKDVSCQGGSLF